MGKSEKVQRPRNFKGPAKAPEPTGAVPGSRGKIEEMIRRAQAGEELCSPLDALEDDRIGFAPRPAELEQSQQRIRGEKYVTDRGLLLVNRVELVNGELSCEDLRIRDGYQLVEQPPLPPAEPLPAWRERRKAGGRKKAARERKKKKP